MNDTQSPAVKLLTAELDGEKIAYSSETEFLIQVGRNKKSSYTTKTIIKGNLEQAVMWYNSLNLGNGFKKRLLAPSMTPPVIAQHQS